MRALGLPNTKHFHEITRIEDAIARASSSPLLAPPLPPLSLSLSPSPLPLSSTPCTASDVALLSPHARSRREAQAGGPRRAEPRRAHRGARGRRGQCVQPQDVRGPQAAGLGLDERANELQCMCAARRACGRGREERGSKRLERGSCLTSRSLGELSSSHARLNLLARAPRAALLVSPLACSHSRSRKLEHESVLRQEVQPDSLRPAQQYRSLRGGKEHQHGFLESSRARARGRRTRTHLLSLARRSSMASARRPSLRAFLRLRTSSAVPTDEEPWP